MKRPWYNSVQGCGARRGQSQQPAEYWVSTERYFHTHSVRLYHVILRIRRSTAEVVRVVYRYMVGIFAAEKWVTCSIVSRCDAGTVTQSPPLWLQNSRKAPTDTTSHIRPLPILALLEHCSRIHVYVRSYDINDIHTRMYVA